MLTREDLMHMRNMSFEDINPAEIPDLDEMNIDVTKSKREKILFLHRISCPVSSPVHIHSRA